MAEHRIEPSSVTKPIQLLAAWLVGLLALNVSFLGAAAVVQQPAWAPGFLVVCAAANVPIFLACLFLLQTKFRPEMQEDHFYSQYLQRLSADTGKVEIVSMSADAVAIPAAPPPLPSKPSLPARSIDTANPFEILLLQVNDMLPQFGVIASRLKKAGLKIHKTFGSSSKEPEVPPFTLMSFSEAAEVEDVQRVLLALDGLIDRIGVASGHLQRGREIYVGSYAYRVDGGHVELTDELKQRLLKSGLKHADMLAAVRPAFPVAA